MAFVRGLPCIVCQETPSENAHICGGGGSRRADARFIVPLCRDCHRPVHVVGARTFASRFELDMEHHAAATDRAWQEHDTNGANW